MTDAGWSEVLSHMESLKQLGAYARVRCFHCLGDLRLHIALKPKEIARKLVCDDCFATFKDNERRAAVARAMEEARRAVEATFAAG